MTKPRGRPRSAPPHQPMQIRMPIDLFGRIKTLSVENGLSYSDVVVEGLRRAFGLADPLTRINFNEGKD